MKRFLLPVLAILVMSACTPVDDFGPYWDKGAIDPGLEGSWKKVGLPGQKRESVPGADMLRFTIDGGSYSLQGINPGARKQDNDTRLAARSIRVGHGRFLMARPADRTDGILQRYEIEGNLLKEYAINNGWAIEFLEAKHPEAESISRNKGDGRFVIIKSFDDEVFQILSEMADNPEVLGARLHLQENFVIRNGLGSYCAFALTVPVSGNVQVLRLVPPLEQAPDQMASRPLVTDSVMFVPVAKLADPDAPACGVKLPVTDHVRRRPRR